MMRALHSGDLGPNKTTKQYDQQLKVLPYLLDNLVCMDMDSLPAPVRNGRSADEHLLNYLAMVEGQPFKNAR
eukprot:1726036-Prymnesium_polylepis.1